jgi:hypothetical protein
MADQGNQKKPWVNKNPRPKEIVIEVENRGIAPKSNGFLVGFAVSAFFKGTNDPLKNKNIEIREKGIYLTHSTTQDSGFAYIEYLFDLNKANSSVTLDVLVEGYSKKETVTLSFQEAPQIKKSSLNNAEYLKIKTGYSRSEASYYITARLLQDVSVALEQDLVIEIDSVLVTRSTDKNGYMRYLVPGNLSPQNPGDIVEVIVTASGIKEPTHDELTWDQYCKQPVKVPIIRNIFIKMLIAMPLLWLISLLFGFSNPVTRLFFTAVMLYSTVVIPILFFFFVSSYGVNVSQFISTVKKKFTTVAGDGLMEKLANSFSDIKSNNHTERSNTSSVFSGNSGHGFRGWVSKAFRGLRSFAVDALMFDSAEHLIKKLFRK